MTRSKKTILFLALWLLIMLYALVNHLKQGATTISKRYSKYEIPVSPPAPALTAPTLDINKWVIYRNKKYNFEVKYPRNWKIDISGQQNLDGLYFSFKYEGTEIVGLGVFKGAITADILDKISPRPEVKNLVINGINMINLSDTDYDIYFEKDGLVYYFTKSMFAQEDDNKTIGAILSTFRFF